jgi:PAS domain S-box-containing protein
MTGYNPEDVLGKSPAILQGSDTDAAVLKRLREDLSEGRPFHGRAINYRQDGSTFMMEWKIAPIRDDSGGVSHFLAIQRDVSDRWSGASGVE